jgi:site-specific DNA-methyltransferase (adenine-specific)
MSKIKMKNIEIKKVIYSNVYQNPSDGYVLTPSELAFEMISTLPEEVFTSSETTFLDPICKSGTFLFEIVERLYNEGHSIENIQKRIFTVDSNMHSLNVANAYINKILNKESGSFKLETSNEFIESFFNQLSSIASNGKYTTFDEFINRILIQKNDKYLMSQLKINLSEFIAKYEKVSKLESKLFGEVFTPRQLIDEMLDTIPKEVWKNKDLKWLDPAVGIGNFPAAILDRLMIGLQEIIPNEDDRRKHILEEMLFMCDISIKNLFLLYKLFDANNEFKLNVYRGSFLEEAFDKHMKEVWGLDGFDVVVGNPPYQSEIFGNKRSKPLYNLFVEDAVKLSKMVLFITPSRWLAGGFGLDPFRKMMFNRIDIKIIKHFSNASELFGNGVEIKGGVSYFLIDKNYIGDVNFDGIYTNFKNYDILVNPKYHNIINKFIDKDSLSSICRSKSFWMNFNDNRLDNAKSFYNKICYVSKNKGMIKYIKFSDITNSSKKYISLYKIFTPYAAGKTGDLGRFGSKIIGYPGEVCSNTYMTLLLNSEEEAKSLLSYMDTKFCNFLLSLRKNTQNMKPDTLKWIPLVPFDREWTDDKLFEYFNLSEDEINLILEKYLIKKIKN